LPRSDVRRRCPEASPAERERRLADLLLGADLAACVYGPLEYTEGMDAF